MKTLFYLLLVTSIIGFTSCEKCSTCVFTNADGTERTSDFCDKGKSYENTLDVYERTNWQCTED